MKILGGSQTIEHDLIATIGFFDGVHCGHKFLLDELKRQATGLGMQSLVISFVDSPQKVLEKSNDLGLLSLPNEKLELLEKQGISYSLMLSFDEQIARMSAAEFLQVLNSRYRVKRLLVGYDHRFGHDQNLVFADYKRIGEQVGVKVIRCQALQQHQKAISSSRVRQHLLDGQIEAANELLGYSYSVQGEVVAGNQIGRSIGFPTANLLVNARKMLPKDGVYAVKVLFDSQQFNGILNIGTRPTIAGNERTVEVYILKFSSDIYGKKLTLRFVRRLRDEHKFESLDLLKKQIEQDILIFQNHH